MLTLVLPLLSFVTIIQCEISESELVYIDVLSSRYLRAHNTLWLAAKSTDSTNRQETFQNIILAHSKLISESAFKLPIDYSNYEALNKNYYFFGYELYQKAHKLDVSWEYLLDYCSRRTLSNKTRRDLMKVIENDLSVAFKIFDETYNQSTSMSDLTPKEVFEQRNCSQKYQISVQSVSQLLFTYYNDLATVYLKAYSLIQFGFMFLTIYKKRDYTSDAFRLRNTYKKQLSEIQNRIKHAMQTSSADSWTCQQKFKNAHNEQDYQVTNFLQGYVDNEINLNNEVSCGRTCLDYKKTRNYGCQQGTYCENPKSKVIRKGKMCKGIIRDCRFMESNMRICESLEENSLELYHSIVMDSGKILRQDSCPGTSKRANSWWSWLVHCSYCLCYCDDEKHSNRFFSLRSVLSDVEQNKVVTGVILRKYNGIFHWRITQDILLPHGRLNTTDKFRQTWREWKEVDAFTTDSNVTTNGVDYHSLTYENRSINLDTILAPGGSTVTGIRFQLLNGHLNLEIRATNFNFSSGLLSTHHEWISNQHLSRSEMKLVNPDYPTNFKEYLPPTNVLQHNQFIKFQPTDFEKDIAQHTVPLLDPNPIAANENSYLLAGIGIFWKGKPHSGGIISPKLISYDFSKHIGIS